jgi:flagellar basal-body rod protein FlgC
MNSIATIAVSGMNAATRRLEVAASNIANQRSTGRMPAADGTVSAGAPRAYAPLRVDQVAISGGTQANVSAVSPGVVPVYDPQAPYADEQGMVATPDVDLGTEMVDLTLARLTFAANVRVLKASDDLTKTILDMKV